MKDDRGREHRQRCGARARHGGRCRTWPITGKKRCRIHGGKLPGNRPGTKVPVGPAHAARDRKQALYRLLGLSWPHGSRHSLERTVDLRERAMADLDATIAAVAAANGTATPGQALARVGSSAPTVRGQLGDAMLEALTRLREIVANPVDQDMLTYEPRKARLIGDMALGVLKLGLQVRESDASVRRDEALAALLEEIAAERAERNPRIGVLVPNDG